MRSVMQRILITGATGFIGGQLAAELARRGDEVVALTRRPSVARLPKGVRPVGWTATEAGDWFAEVSGTDAVIHLAGEQAVGVRWTEETKRRMTESRVTSTRQLVAAMKQAQARPKVFVCASAVGYHGDRGKNEALTEDAQPGSDFLATLTQQWEEAATAAEDLGVRVVRVRFGIVLGAGGGALEEMAKPFRLFAGGPIGSGKQMISWISVEDTVRAVCFVLDHDSISGPVNVVAPNPVDNERLSKEIGKALSRPSWLRVPEAALRLRFGEGADPLLTGQRVRPAVLERAGFSWHHPELSAALSAAFAGP